MSSKTMTEETEYKIPLRVIFNTVAAVMDIIHAVGRVNEWRQEIQEPTSYIIDADIYDILKDERTSPPSKKTGHNAGDKNTLWHHTHMALLIPAIRTLQDKVKEQKLRDETIFRADARLFIPNLDDIERHIIQRQSYKEKIEQFDPKALPDDYMDLPDEDLALLTDVMASPPSNHLYGRLLQAHYAEELNSFQIFGLPAEARYYFEGGKRSILERTLMYAQNRVNRCPLASDCGTVPDQIPMSNMILYYIWLADPAVVEMITPRYTGAAKGASNALWSLLEHVYKKTGIDLRDVTVNAHALNQLRSAEGLHDRFNAALKFLERNKHPYHQDVTALTNLIWPQPHTS